VLALQGASGAHVERFAALGHTAREVRAPADLAGLSHLVLPGGESTTIHHLLELFDLRAVLSARWREGRLALFGVCAGAILLARDHGEAPPRFGLLDATLRRNAHGRQVHSARRAVRWTDDEHGGSAFDALFIRAPRIEDVGASVRVLARDGDDPVLLEAPRLLACTFHPELGPDPEIHRHFLRA
jgi:5'-phosphate synthase pdxT subunit